MDKKWLDLGQQLLNEMPVYPGDPVVERHSFLNHDKDGCHVERISFGSHAGTHIDVPYHIFPKGRKLDDFPLDYFIRPGIVIDISATCQAGGPILPESLAACRDIAPETMLCLRTGWDRFYGQDRYWQHPYLTAEAAMLLVGCQIRLIGIDAPGFDKPGNIAVHKIFLSRDILLVENLAHLEQLTVGQEYLFSLLPLALSGGDGSPIRAVAVKL